MADWVTISALATATGTLVLATATFASVRSSNRSARAAERAVLAGIRPLLSQSRFDDAKQKVYFVDDHMTLLEGGRASAEAVDGTLYLAISLRNSGSGIAVLDRWNLRPERLTADVLPGDPSTFRRLSRDIYIAANEVGFWQGAFRDPAEPGYAEIAHAIAARETMTLDLLYGDSEGGQHTITRFALIPRGDGDVWLATVGRHWNIERDDPR